MKSANVDELRRLELLQGENPKRREALDTKVRELRGKRGDLIAASATGDGSASGKLDKLDAEIVAILREKTRFEESNIELNHAISFVKLKILRELGQRQLDAIGSIERELGSAIKALAKTVQSTCSESKAAFDEMNHCAGAFGGAAGLGAFGEVGKMLQGAFNEALQAGVASILLGNGGHVDLAKCKAILEGLLEEAIDGAEQAVTEVRGRDRATREYDRSELDRFLAATAAS